MFKLFRVSILLFFLWIIACGLWTTHAAVPHLINYQGRLTGTEGKPQEGAKNITFRIYDSESAGKLLWTEMHPGVVIDKGVFSVMLGAVTPLDLPFDKQYFLEITVGDETMSPRQRIASAGYAMRAKEADSLPKDVILICKGFCPAGYKRIGQLDGKFLTGGATYNPNAGGSNTHMHGAGNYKGPSHTHAQNAGPVKLYGCSMSGFHVTYGNLGGGQICNGASHSNLDWENHEGRELFAGVQAGGVEPITGTSASGDSRPEFATVVLCEKE